MDPNKRYVIGKNRSLDKKKVTQNNILEKNKNSEDFYLE